MRQLIITSILIVVTMTALFVGLAIKRTFQKPPPVPKVTVTIPEGSTVKDINDILTKASILTDTLLESSLEGYLFPDTYEFFIPSGVEVVKSKFRENFDSKIALLFPEGISEEKLRELIIIASLVEREIPDFEDRKIVAGIINKRIENGIPLQIDATICYIKDGPCLPISKDDKNINSLYNTYRYRGLPIGPINSPGLDAIKASGNPKASPYLYYISEQQDGETIFSKSLDEHNSNVVKYLSN